MRIKAAPLLLLTLLLCALAAAGCGGSSSGSKNVAGAEDADTIIAALKAFTEELLAKVESARDVKAGVADAQALLDSRKDALAARVAAFKRGASFGEHRGRWLEVEVDNVDRVHRLQLNHSEEASRDPEFKARLDRLVSDYDSIFK